MKRTWLAAVLGAAALAVTGCATTPSSAPTLPPDAFTPGTGATAADAGLHWTGGSQTPQLLRLRAMPTGVFRLGRNGSGQLTAWVSVTGLTPGSTHAVDLDVPGPHVPVLSFRPLTANSVGAASAILTSKWTGRVPSGAHLDLRVGLFGAGAVADEPIAQSATLSEGSLGHEIALHAVDINTAEVKQGTLVGWTELRYSAAAHTITVTLTAFGLTPGAHAAHIHLGSCASQGAVKYMLTDFTADNLGVVLDQTRVVTGVTSAPPTTGWYLNLHQGDANTILDAAGNPTPAFRPLLCANL